MRELKVAFRRDRFVLIVAGVCYLLLTAALISVGLFPIRPEAYLGNLVLYLSTFMIYIGLRLIWSLYRYRPESPIRYFLSVEWSKERQRSYLAALPATLALIIFMPAFSAFKSAIPLFSDFTWDAHFADLDVAIHGADPWLLMQPVIGYPIVTFAIVSIYHLWILLIYAGGLYFAAIEGHDYTRARYLCCYFLTWTVVGAGLAVNFASVGPIFMEPLLGDERFMHIKQYLVMAAQHYPVPSLEVQQTLIDWHKSGDHGLGRGITAMPSMHLALAMLFFLAIKDVSRRAGVFFGIFLSFIMIGSVHTGYHYAVDGYVAILVTWAIWMVVGKLLKYRSETA